MAAPYCRLSGSFNPFSGNAWEKSSMDETDSKIAPEWLSRIQHEQAELEARYKSIDQAWQDSGIPRFVLETPDWQTGWRILHDWLGLHDFRARDAKAWESIVALSWPNAKTSWVNEIHIFSHMHNSTGSHSPEHAVIEEEGTRAILAWWRGMSVRGSSDEY
jgi:hypothetical protein